MSIPFCEKILNNFCEGNFMDNANENANEKGQGYFTLS